MWKLSCILVSLRIWKISEGIFQQKLTVIINYLCSNWQPRNDRFSPSAVYLCFIFNNFLIMSTYYFCNDKHRIVFTSSEVWSLVTPLRPFSLWSTNQFIGWAKPVIWAPGSWGSHPRAASESPGGLVPLQITGAHPQSSWFRRSGVGSTMRVPNEFPRAVAAATASLGTTL